MSKPRAALVHLGRRGGMGTWTRINGLRTVFEEAGAEVHDVQLRIEHRPVAGDLMKVKWADLLTSRAVPETLAWSPVSVLRHLLEIDPAVVLCCTSRAYHPVLAEGPWRIVLDFIDRLSVSYRDRSTIEGIGPKRALFGALAWPNERFEARAHRLRVETIAAGWADARDLGATWVPITVPIPSRPLDPSKASHDLLFFGNLTYPPNVEAVQRLARLWERIIARRPGTSLLVAGNEPIAPVRDAAERHGWTLLPNFPAVNDLLASARLGVVPLEHASGIQIKVLEAAAFGLAQVLSPAARTGLGPQFPVRVGVDDAEFVSEVVRLLDDPARCRAVADEAREHMIERFTAKVWVPWASGLLDTADARV